MHVQADNALYHRASGLSLLLRKSVERTKPCHDAKLYVLMFLRLSCRWRVRDLSVMINFEENLNLKAST